MLSVEALAVRRIELLHESRDRVLVRDEEQMIVIEEEAIRHARHVKPRRRRGQQLEEGHAVGVVHKDAAFVVAARVDVMQHSRGVQTERTCHAHSRGKILARQWRHDLLGNRRNGLAKRAETARTATAPDGEGCARHNPGSDLVCCVRVNRPTSLGFLLMLPPSTKTQRHWRCPRGSVPRN